MVFLSASSPPLHRAMPVDPMDDIELRSVQLQYPNQRGSIVGQCDLRRVPTDKGDILVAVQGDTTKPAIVTYHDLGLNCEYFCDGERGWGLMGILNVIIASANCNLITQNTVINIHIFGVSKSNINKHT